MAADVDSQVDEIIPGANGRGQVFLEVLIKSCRQQGVPVNFQPMQRRSSHGGGIVLKAKMGDGQEIEAFADDMGTNLHVGYQLVTKVLGGSVLGGVGAFGEINRLRAKSQAKAGNVRKMSGALKALELVFTQTIQQLADAVRYEQSQGSSSGFLGA